MSKSLANSDSRLSLGDFDQIEQAVMETPRGRWFLQEYSRRQRDNDTQSLLSALLRLQQAVAANQDELLQRLTSVLDKPDDAAAEPHDVPPVILTGRQKRLFGADEDLFEPAITAAEPRPAAHLVVHESDAAHAPDSVDATASPGLPLQAATASTAESHEAARRRIVIIRHQPGDEIDVPFENDKAADSDSASDSDA